MTNNFKNKKPRTNISYFGVSIKKRKKKKILKEIRDSVVTKKKNGKHYRVALIAACAAATLAIGTLNGEQLT